MSNTAYNILIVAVGIALASCSDTVLDQEPKSEQSGLPINFVDAEDSVSLNYSRGHETTANNMQTFAVSATIYSQDGSRTLYFAHEQYHFYYLGEDVYKTVSGNIHYWLSNKDEYNFFAYSPSPYLYFAPGVVDKFIYTTPKNILSHPDIVVATAIAAEYGQPVPLEFTHPLAEISFYQGQYIRPGRIISIKLSGIIDHGEYNMLTGEWYMNTLDTDSFVWNCDVKAMPDTDLSGEYYNFFFVPQQLGDDARITVTFLNSYGVTEIHQVPLSGTWQAGHRYRYSISL